MTAAQKK